MSGSSAFSGLNRAFSPAWKTITEMISDRPVRALKIIRYETRTMTSPTTTHGRRRPNGPGVRSLSMPKTMLATPDVSPPQKAV